MSESGAFDSIAPIMPDIVREISQWQLPRSSDSLPLGEINVPVLLLHGPTRTRSTPTSYNI